MRPRKPRKPSQATLSIMRELELLDLREQKAIPAADLHQSKMTIEAQSLTIADLKTANAKLMREREILSRGFRYLYRLMLTHEREGEAT